MAQDRSGNILCGTHFEHDATTVITLGGYYTFNGRSWSQTPLNGPIGFGSAAVSCLLLDEGNNLWAGTSQGLYCGSQPIPEALQNSGINCLLDDGHAVWVGTSGAGLWRCATNEWTTFGTTESVLSLTTDNQGTLWANTTAGLAVYDATGWHMVTGAQVPSNVSCMTMDSKGTMWFCSPGQISTYNLTGWHTLTAGDGIPPGTINQALSATDGSMWFMGQTFLAKYRAGEWSLLFTEQQYSARLTHAIIDNSGTLWVGDTGGSLMRYDADGWQNLSAGGPVTSLFISGDGALWVGTDGGGVSRHSDDEWRTWSVSTASGSFLMTKLPSGSIWSAQYCNAGPINNTRAPGGYTFYPCPYRADIPFLGVYEERDSAVWIGTFGYGATRCSSQGPVHYTTYNGVDTLRMCLLEDGEGGLWFGTSGQGVARYLGPGPPDPYITTGWTNYLSNTYVVSMLADSLGNVWAITYNSGVERFDGAGWSQELAGKAIHAMVADGLNGVWFATDAGLAHYDGSTWSTLTAADGLGGDDITDLYRARDGTIWCCASGELSWKDSNIWRHMHIGWTPSVITQDRDGTMWFGGGNQLLQYDGVRWSTRLQGVNVSAVCEDRSGAHWYLVGSEVVRDDGKEVRTFTVADGLPSGVRYMFDDPAGTLWFGTGSSITGHVSDRVPPLTLIDLMPPALSTNRVPIVQYSAAYGEASALFQTSLDGQPWSDWSATGYWASHVLADGRHVFRVRARDAENNVEAPPESVVFEIDTAAPSPTITVPLRNSAVSDSFAIRGTAADQRFAFYRVDYRGSGASSWTTLVDSVRQQVSEGVLAGWSTRALTDGLYELRVSVTDTLGLTGQAIVPVSVDNHFPYAGQTSPALVTAAAGGNVYTVDASAHLYVPPHALTEDATIAITPLDSTELASLAPSGSVALGRGYSVSWGAVSMGKSAVLELSLADTNVPMGSSPVLYLRRDSLAWQRLGGTVDASTARISLATTAPGHYALCADNGVALGSRALAGLSFTPRVFSATGGFGSRDVGISFTLGRTASVTVKVYSLNGRLVRDVADGVSLQAGANLVRWDGRNREGSMVSDGLYLVTVEAMGQTERRPLAVVR